MTEHLAKSRVRSIAISSGDTNHDLPEKMLLQRRYELYDRASEYLLELEDAVKGEDLSRSFQIYENLYNHLKKSLAFLTSGIYSCMESTREYIEETDGLDFNFKKLHVLANLLHAEISKLLTKTDMEPLEYIISMNNKQPKAEQPVETVKREEKNEAGEKPKIELDLHPAGPSVDEKPVGTTVEKPVEKTGTEPWRKFEEKASKAMADLKYKRAIKLYKKAIKRRPSRASLHNDIGLAYRKNSDILNAVIHYRKAVSLNDRNAPERTSEYYNVFFNLGLALKDRSVDLFKERKIKDAIDLNHEAKRSFERYVESSPDERRIKSAREQIKAVDKELANLNRMWNIITAGEQRIDFDRIRQKLHDAGESQTAESDSKTVLSETIEEVLSDTEDRNPQSESNAEKEDKTENSPAEDNNVS